MFSRRVFIQMGTGTGAGFLLGACSSPTPSAAPTRPAAPTSPPATSAVITATTAPAATPAPTVIGAAASGKNSAALPNYIAPNLAAKRDYDAHDPRVTLAWDNYPKSPPTSWNKPAPGTGSTVTAFAVDYYPPPTPYADNPTWQAVNKPLNANLQMTLVMVPTTRSGSRRSWPATTCRTSCTFTTASAPRRTAEFFKASVPT